MATDIHLLKSCHFYRGEAFNPYEGKDQNKAMLWFYEMGWVKNASLGRSPSSSDMLEEYSAVGLRDFCNGDGVALSLKALLFNRFARTERSLAEAVEPFKVFYKKYYQ